MPKEKDSFIDRIDKSLDDMGFGVTNAAALEKAEAGGITLDNTNFENLLPREVVEQMIDDSHKQNEWMSAINTVRRQAKTGRVPIIDINGNTMEGIGEDEAPTNLKRPGTRTVPYHCKGFVQYYYITVDQIKEAIAAGITNMEDAIITVMGKARGNDLANIVMNSKTTLDDSTSLNRMLRMIDGLAVKAESSNVIDAQGTVLLNLTDPDDVFAAMDDALPEVYANDPGLRWIIPRRVDAHYRKLIRKRETPMGDRELTVRDLSKPLGIPPLVVPQISVRQGPDPIAPTSVADQTTYITFDLTALVSAGHVASVAAGVGRKFKVTCLATGHSEICTGYEDTQLKIDTTGLLGQSTVSTTAADYEVGLYDETDVYLMNPQAVTMIECYEMESYREFIPKFRRWEFLTFQWLDVLMPIPAAIVKLKRLGVPQISLS